MSAIVVGLIRNVTRYVIERATTMLRIHPPPFLRPHARKPIIISVETILLINPSAIFDVPLQNSYSFATEYTLF